jgi:hypothetical protein
MALWIAGQARNDKREDEAHAGRWAVVEKSGRIWLQRNPAMRKQLLNI